MKKKRKERRKIIDLIEKQYGADTWHESLGGDEGNPTASAADIAKSARDNGGKFSASEKDIRLSAQGDGAFDPSKGERSEYERLESKNTGFEHFAAQETLALQAREYTKMAYIIAAAYQSTVGKALEEIEAAKAAAAPSPGQK